MYLTYFSPAGVDGGFYLTDSLLAAGQFACRDVEPTAYILGELTTSLADIFGT